MKRRTFLASAGAVGVLSAGTSCYFWPEDGITNPCLDVSLPKELAGNELIVAAWEDIDTAKVWDCHVHLLGTGNSGGGAWVNPDMRTASHPILFAQFKFFLNASCVDDTTQIDEAYVARLVAINRALAPGSRLMLLAFDYSYDVDGQQVIDLSHFHVPNEYARDVAKAHPDQFEWIASIHPYRKDAVTALEAAVADGARAVKWLPPSMGMDPGSPRCDAFYEAMARLDVPLLSHGGLERAVHVPEAQELGNPLRLRRPLDHGVRVVVAHCASMGKGIDTDRGSSGPKVENFDLFARLMEDHRYEGLVFGDVSAMTQLNRIGPPLDAVLEREEWHTRLLNGSDYPLPGVFPLFSLKAMVARDYLTEEDAEVIRAIRSYNPVLFDFVLKRAIKHGGKGFSASVFETRDMFTRTRRA